MSLKKNILANYFGAGWTALMSIAFIPFYIRYLGIEAYGIIGVFIVLQSLLLVLDFGMAPTISREMARYQAGIDDCGFIRNLLRSVEIIAVFLAVVIGVAIYSISPWLAKNWLMANGLPVKVMADALVIMGGIIGLRIIENIYRGALVGLQRQVSLNMITVVGATLRGPGAVAILASVSPTLNAYFLWQGLVSILSLFWFAITTYSTLPGISKRASFSLGALKMVRRFAAGSMALASLSLLLTSTDKILLSRLLSLDEFGYYTFAFVVAQTPLGLVAPMVQAFYPRLTQLFGSGNEVALMATYHRAAQLVTVMLGSATVVLIVFGESILLLWTGDPVLTGQAYALMVVLALGSLLNGLVTVPYYMQLAAGRTALMVRVAAIQLLVVVPSLLLAVPRYGALGGAWVWALLNLVNMSLNAPLMHQRMMSAEIRSWYICDIATPLAAAAAAGCALHWLLPSSHGSLLSELCAVGVGATLIVMSTVVAAPIVRNRVAMVLRSG